MYYFSWDWMIIKKRKNLNLKMLAEKHGEKEKKDVMGVHRGSLTRKK